MNYVREDKILYRPLVLIPLSICISGFNNSAPLTRGRYHPEKAPCRPPAAALTDATMTTTSRTTIVSVTLTVRSVTPRSWKRSTPCLRIRAHHLLQTLSSATTRSCLLIYNIQFGQPALTSSPCPSHLHSLCPGCPVQTSHLYIHHRPPHRSYTDPSLECLQADLLPRIP